MNLFNSGAFYGAFVGNSFSMKNGGTFGYDSRLSTVGINDVAAVFNVQHWSEN